MSQCFHLLWGEAVVFEEESGLTSSGSAKQGEIQRVKTATFYTSGSTYSYCLMWLHEPTSTIL